MNLAPNATLFNFEAIRTDDDVKLLGVRQSDTGYNLFPISLSLIARQSFSHTYSLPVNCPTIPVVSFIWTFVRRSSIQLARALHRRLVIN